MTPLTVGRHPVAENRVTIQNVSEWQDIRAAHDQMARDVTHNLVHLVKAMGPIAASIEHRHHGEPDVDFDPKRYADLIIHAIWLTKAMGHDPATLVANRMWQLGIGPKREELPPSERR